MALRILITSFLLLIKYDSKSEKEGEEKKTLIENTFLFPIDFLNRDKENSSAKQSL